QGSQTVAFTSTAPSDATVNGATYTPTASASSGLTTPVTFSIDSASTSVCSIAAGVVSFDAIGTCTVNADRGGNKDWLAAPTVSQSFDVVGKPQTITFSTAAPADAVVGGSTY